MLQIREYQQEDLSCILKLFFETVHSINAKDYTAKQLKVWAPDSVDEEHWHKSLSQNYAVVAVEDDVIVGFGDISSMGYLDRLYVHKDKQSQGIATAICEVLETQYPDKKIVTYASITAVPFFKKRGYRIQREQYVVRNGIRLKNYIMQKTQP